MRQRRKRETFWGLVKDYKRIHRKLCIISSKMCRKQRVRETNAHKNASFSRADPVSNVQKLRERRRRERRKSSDFDVILVKNKSKMDILPLDEKSMYAKLR